LENIGVKAAPIERLATCRLCLRRSLIKER
jgi:hypothetical protein